MEKLVFNLIKEYGSEYLYGFDKDQLEFNLIGGKVSLKVVNLRPDKINQLLAENGIPMNLKSGMLTNFNANISTFSLIKEFTTNKLFSKKLQSEKASIEVTVDEILIVLGPSRANYSTEEDFDWDRNPEQTYVSIEDERRRVKRKKRKPVESKSSGSKSIPTDTSTSGPESIKTAIEMFMNLVSVNVNKIHIRFENDDFCYYDDSSKHPAFSPYAFGIVLNSLNINSPIHNNRKTQIQFQSVMDLNYEEVYPEDDTNLFVKHILLQDIAVYWNSNEEVYIPMETEQKTINMDQKIFDYQYLEPEEFRILMIQPFREVKEYMDQGKLSRRLDRDVYFNYFINPFTIEVNLSYYRLNDEDVKKHRYPRFQMIALISSLRMTVRPRLVEDLRNFMEYMQYQMMLPFLQRYKPRRRPLSESVHPVTSSNKAVRRQIVKDWFAYVIWANRLKKVLRNDICPELFEEEIELNRHKYEKALAKLRNPRDNLFLDRNLKRDRGHDVGHINSMVAPVIDEIYERKEYEQSKVNNEFFRNFLQKFLIEVKVQSVEVELFSDDAENYLHGNKIPTLKIFLGRLRVALNIEDSMLTASVMLEDIKILDTLVLNNRRDPNDTFTTTMNGEFQDEEINSFFARHREENSIFLPPDHDGYDNQYAREKYDDEERQRMFDNKLTAERDKSIHTTRDLDPDEFFGFDKEGRNTTHRNKDDSRFNFEGFWRNKLGKLIGMGNKEKKAQGPKRQELFDSHNREYTDDDGNPIMER